MISKLAITAAGHLVIVGYLVDGLAAPSAMVVAKYDVGQGQRLWRSTTLSGDLPGALGAVAVDHDDTILVAGTIGSDDDADVFVARLAP